MFSSVKFWGLTTPSSRLQKEKGVFLPPQSSNLFSCPLRILESVLYYYIHHMALRNTFYSFMYSKADCEGPLINVHINSSLISCISPTFLTGNIAGCQEFLDYFMPQLEFRAWSGSSYSITKRNSLVAAASWISPEGMHSLFLLLPPINWFLKTKSYSSVKAQLKFYLFAEPSLI